MAKLGALVDCVYLCQFFAPEFRVPCLPPIWPFRESLIFPRNLLLNLFLRRSFSLQQQDGSDYYIVASNLKKIFEEKYAKMVKDDGMSR